MLSQIIFILLSGIGFYLFYKSISRIRKNILMGRSISINDRVGERIKTMCLVALGQGKMFTRPLAAILHIFVYVGFVLINIEVLEIIIDGIAGTHRVLQAPLGNIYTYAIAFFEILGLLVIIACIIFLIRRNVLSIKRFKQAELKGFPFLDANAILITEIVLMSALLIMNAADNSISNMPISTYLKPLFTNVSENNLHIIMLCAWWFHWIGILVFLNYVPYSKHLHILLAFPNTYYSNLNAKGKINNVQSITTEVQLMLDPNAAPPENYTPPTSFGAKDVTDLTWKNLLDAYSCTECGRCTSVCPANITGKLLSPRKIMMDTRDRLEERSKFKRENNSTDSDNKSLHSYISAEELWACTTCNACVQICPVNISPLDIIIQMRQYLVMEQSAAPSELNNMFTNLENNGAPWQFPPSDRANWIQ